MEKHKNDQISPSNKNESNINQSNLQKYLLRLKEIIDVLSFFILVATLLVSTMTIFEMRKDRNESYKAVIAGNPFSETMFISENGEPGIPNYFNPDDNQNLYISGYVQYLDSSSESGSYEIKNLPDDMQGETLTYSQFKLANIAPGMATKVTLSWDDNNIQILNNTLSKILKTNSTRFRIPMNNEREILYMTYVSPELRGMTNNGASELSFPTDTEFSYMLPECGETYTVDFPIVYSLFFSEILLHDYSAEPAVSLNVEFTDTQGLKYDETITFKVSNFSIKYLRSSEGLPGCYGITYRINLYYDTPIAK